jgi:ATP/maltotriose-dependent transcriptional regulator MalT
MALCEGPTPATEAIERAEQVRRLGLVDRQAEALVLLSLAKLHAMRGDFQPAGELAAKSGELVRDLGATILAARSSYTCARIELMAGNVPAAERLLRADYDSLTALNERYFRPVIAALLAQALFDLGRADESGELAELARELGSDDDIEAQALARSVQAKIQAARGEPAQAHAVADEAVELARRSDSPTLQADALVDLSVVLSAPEDARERVAALEEARSLYERKEHLVGVDFVDRALAAIAAAA